MECQQSFWCLVEDKIATPGGFARPGPPGAAPAGSPTPGLSTSGPLPGRGFTLRVPTPRHRRGGAAGVAAYCRHGAIPPPRDPGPLARRTPRRLTELQQTALRDLRRLGAPRLDSAFSLPELKAAFRSLAKRFHPDRHPRSSDAAQAGLAATFSRVREAYCELASVEHVPA